MGVNATAKMHRCRPQRQSSLKMNTITASKLCVTIATNTSQHHAASGRPNKYKVGTSYDGGVEGGYWLSVLTDHSTSRIFYGRVRAAGMKSIKKITAESADPGKKNTLGSKIAFNASLGKVVTDSFTAEPLCASCSPHDCADCTTRPLPAWAQP